MTTAWRRCVTRSLFGRGNTDRESGSHGMQPTAESPRTRRAYRQLSRGTNLAAIRAVLAIPLDRVPEAFLEVDRRPVSQDALRLA